jgi:hypothetical protein
MKFLVKDALFCGGEGADGLDQGFDELEVDGLGFHCCFWGVEGMLDVLILIRYVLSVAGRNQSAFTRLSKAQSWRVSCIGVNLEISRRQIP